MKRNSKPLVVEFFTSPVMKERNEPNNRQRNSVQKK